MTPKNTDDRKSIEAPQGDQVSQSLPAGSPFILSRTFKVGLELIFDIWTKPEHLQHWFGPKGGQIKYSKMDFRSGGTYHYCMDYAGNEMWGKFVYREILKPNRIVYVGSFSNPEGGISRHPLSPDWPKEMLTTITFTEKDGFTTVQIEWMPIHATAKELEVFEAARGSMSQGWTGTLERLQEYLLKY